MEKEFIRLINNHIAIIHKICNVFFYNKPDKEDYFQEILIRLWKSFPNFQKQSKFSTWMYRVALNTAIDIVRKTDNQPAFARLSPRELNMPIIQDQVYSIKVEKLYNAIKNLSNSEKAIILLYLEDYNYREISEVIGISESNAGVKINRIKKKLIKMLDDDGKK